jgi:hypothetical protein
MKNARITFAGVSMKIVNKFTEFMEKESFIYNERKYNLRIAISEVEIKEEKRAGDFSGNFEVNLTLAREYEKYLSDLSSKAADKLFLDLLLRIVSIFNTDF